MPVIGFLLIIWIICIAVIPKSLKSKVIIFFMTTLFFELYANSGTLLGGIKYNDILWLILFICTYLFVGSKGINPFRDSRYVFFLLLLLAELIIEVVWPYNAEGFNIRSLFVLFKYLFSVYVYLILLKTLTNADYKKILNQIFGFQLFIYIVALFEFSYENILGMGNYGELLASLFGPSENMVTWNETRFGLSSIQGLCKEPSHFAIMLFFSNIFNLLSYKYYPKSIKYFIINCVLMIISGSLSSILFILILFLFWIVYFPIKHKTFYIVTIGVLFSVVAYTNADVISYYAGRLSNIASFSDYGVDTYTSEGVRIASALESWQMFKSRPLFGIGLGNNVNTCGFFTLISTIGLIGLIVFLKTVVRTKFQWVTVSVVFISTFFAMDGGVFYSSYFFFVLLLCCFHQKQIIIANINMVKKTRNQNQTLLRTE